MNQRENPLTEAEASAVADGMNAVEELLAQLSHVPTPEGPTPGSFRADSFRSNRRTKGANDASAMGRL